MFASTPADIAIYGGEAFGGKTYGLLLDPLHYLKYPGFGAVLFRQQFTDIIQEGGLWDEAMGLYPKLGGRPRQSPRMDFRFPTGARISFSHLHDEETVRGKKGGQIAMIGYDQVEDIPEDHFWYMFSRMRTKSGVRPYARATCNPDPDSWIANFINWWVDQDEFLPDGDPNPCYGKAIEERSGVMRWMIKLDEQLQWFDTLAEAMVWHKQNDLPPEQTPKSVTFIHATRYDNPIGMREDPQYVSQLYLLDRVNRARLLGGNWKVRAKAGMYFKRDDFGVLDKAPDAKEILKAVRSWDFAGTEVKRSRSMQTMHKRAFNDPDWTVGCKAVLLKNQDVVFLDMQRDRKKPGGVQDMVRSTAHQDGRIVRIRIPQDPGQAGKDQVENYQKRVLKGGYIMRSERETADKVTRIEDYSSYVEHKHVYIVRGPWNDAFLAEHEAFPTPGVKMDIVDAAGGAYRMLRGKPQSTAELMAQRLKRK